MPPPDQLSPAQSPTAEQPAAAADHPPRAAGSMPSPPPRSPTQSVGVASFSAVAMASFSSVVDTSYPAVRGAITRRPVRPGVPLGAERGVGSLELGEGGYSSRRFASVGT